MFVGLWGNNLIPLLPSLKQRSTGHLLSQRQITALISNRTVQTERRALNAQKIPPAFRKHKNVLMWNGCTSIRSPCKNTVASGLAATAPASAGSTSPSNSSTDKSTRWLTSLTLLPAGIEVGVAIDKLADGVETTATVTGVHYGVLDKEKGEGTKLEMSPALLGKLCITLLGNMTKIGYGIF